MKKKLIIGLLLGAVTMVLCSCANPAGAPKPNNPKVDVDDLISSSPSPYADDFSYSEKKFKVNWRSPSGDKVKKIELKVKDHPEFGTKTVDSERNAMQSCEFVGLEPGHVYKVLFRCLGATGNQLSNNECDVYMYPKGEKPKKIGDIYEFGYYPQRRVEGTDVSSIVYDHTEDLGNGKTILYANNGKRYLKTKVKIWASGTKEEERVYEFEPITWKVWDSNYSYGEKSPVMEDEFFDPNLGGVVPNQNTGKHGKLLVSTTILKYGKTFDSSVDKTDRKGFFDFWQQNLDLHPDSEGKFHTHENLTDNSYDGSDVRAYLNSLSGKDINGKKYIQNDYTKNGFISIAFNEDAKKYMLGNPMGKIDDKVFLVSGKEVGIDEYDQGAGYVNYEYAGGFSDYAKETSGLYKQDKDNGLVFRDYPTLKDDKVNGILPAIIIE